MISTIDGCEFFIVLEIHAQVTSQANTGAVERAASFTGCPRIST